MRLIMPDIAEEEISEVIKVLKSGLLVQGKNVNKFESKVAEFLNVKYAVAVSSGTAALCLALITIGIKDGDEVILPDFTHPATGNVVALTNAKPVLVDIDLRTYNIDSSKIKKNLSARTKAILPVHQFGQSADMDPVLDIAKKYNLYVIEDSACALGAKYKDNKCGTMGDAGCFSFHPRKVITTGEGGMVVTNIPDIAMKVKALRNHGVINKDGKNYFAYAGFNYRLTDFQGALGCVQIEKLEKTIDKRRELAAIYDFFLKETDILQHPFAPSYNKHTYQSYVVLLDEKIDRDAVIRKLKEKSIETTIGTYALHSQPFYKENYGYEEGNFKNSYKAFKQSLCLPLYVQMKKKDIKEVVENLLRAVRKEKRINA